MTIGNAPPHTPRRNFYGRRSGKTLKPRQRQDLSDLLPRVRLSGVNRQENPRRVPLDLSRFEGRPLWLEIGFGGGEHLVAQARANPQTAFIGCEPFVNGVAMFLGKLRQEGLNNVWVHPAPVLELLEVLPPASVRKVFLLYPDPWPKTRHHRRRFVTAGHLLPLARTMAKDAELRIATDIPDYVRQTLEEVPRAGFSWQAEGAQDWRKPWLDWTRTRYEAKALREGREPYYLTFTRTPQTPPRGEIG